MNILLGVCGSISAYKSFDILRGFLKNGHKVKVVCTKGALNFVVPQVYKYLGAKEVYTSMDDFSYPKSDLGDSTSTVLHIELTKWADKIIIAPLSANTLASFAHGMARDLLSSVFLACSKETPIILFPAMNTQMYEHPFTKENIDLLQKLNTLPQVFIHKPDDGLLACGDTGVGKLPSVETIVDICEAIHYKEKSPKMFLITTGATISPLDPVRFLTNASSGITGYELAVEALSNGHEVIVIAGQKSSSRLDSLRKHPFFKLIRVITTEDMANSVKEYISKADVYISSAAINDIKFISSENKLKKSDITNTLKIEKTIDILKMVLENKNPSQKIIGFAAETTLSKEVLDRKYISKPVDLLIGTLVHHGLTDTQKEGSSLKGFGTNEAQYSFLENGKCSFTGSLTKKELAKAIIEKVTHA